MTGIASNCWASSSPSTGGYSLEHRKALDTATDQSSTRVSCRTHGSLKVIAKEQRVSLLLSISLTDGVVVVVVDALLIVGIVR